MSNRTTYIYVLSDGEKYYVGKADNAESRYGLHVSRAFNPNSRSYRNRSAKWIRSYGSSEMAKHYIGVKVIETVTAQDVDDDEWKEIWGEREKTHIASYRNMYGYENVMNDTDGGEGFSSGENNPNAKLNWEIIDYIRKNYGKIKNSALMNKFYLGSRHFFRIVYNEVWLDSGYTPPQKPHDLKGENHGSSKLTWYKVFQFRINYTPNGKGEHSRKHWAKLYGVHQKNLGWVFRNETWHDPNWDPKRRVYTGPPHGWEEDWGSWER